MATILTILYQNKKVFLYFLLGVLLLVFFSFTYSSVYNSGFEDGKEVVVKELALQQKEFDEQRRALNLRIQDLAKQTQQDLNNIEDKKAVTREKVYVYSTKHSGSTATVDDEWLRIYNNSLPE